MHSTLTTYVARRIDEGTTAIGKGIASPAPDVHVIANELCEDPMLTHGR